MFRIKILTSALLLVLVISAVATAQRATAPRNRDRNQQAQTQPTSGRGGETFTDPRDGQTYRLVTIGGVTWFAENMRYEQIHDDLFSCYNNDGANCRKYGMLYTWNAALNICPDGWELPFDEDWNALLNAVGGTEAAAVKLRTADGWQNRGTDDFGFSALPGGFRDNEGEFRGLGETGNFWSGATCHETNSQKFFGIGAYPNNFSMASYASGVDATMMMSVRCVVARARG